MGSTSYLLLIEQDVIAINLSNLSRSERHAAAASVAVVAAAAAYTQKRVVQLRRKNTLQASCICV